MTVSTTNGKYFWLLNLLALITVIFVPAISFFSPEPPTGLRRQLDGAAHYVTNGFDLSADMSGAIEFPAGVSPRGEALGSISAGHTFLRPGEMPYGEYTIAASFDYTAQYDKLMESPGVIPGVMLARLGDNFEIYLNGNLVHSEWHVDGDAITLHKLARDIAYPINPSFFVRGGNTISYRVYGDPTTVDMGLTIAAVYCIDDMRTFSPYNLPQIVFAGAYLAVALIFAVFFLLYREKKLNLWFSMSALAVSIYTLFRINVFRSIIPQYELAARLEIVLLYTFAYFATVLIYTSGKEKFNLIMKIFTGIYVVFCAAMCLPGRQFIVDLLTIFYFIIAPFLLYSFICSLCVPFVREIKRRKRESGIYGVFRVLSGSLIGNMLIAAMIPVTLSLFDQMTYVLLSYQPMVLSPYGFLLFFANVTFALASDNAEMHGRLLELSGELRRLVSERESQLEQKSGEVEKVKTTQARFRETVSKEIRAPLGEIIGSIELRLLRTGMPPDMSSWLRRLLESQRGIRKQLDAFLGDEAELSERVISPFEFENAERRFGAGVSPSNPGGTRHLFVINPKSFVSLNDLKDFLLSIEKCFSAGHRAEYKVYISRYPRDAYSAVNRYLAATPPDETARVYAVGGDGILFDCLNGLARFPNAELAPIPYGNANDFARAFGAENMKLFRDIKLMSKSPHRLVDVILCGEQYALCDCSIGIEGKAVHVFSDVIEKINSGKARSFVPLLYKIGAIKSLLDGSMNNMNYRLTLDGKDHSGEYLLVNITNIALNGGTNIPSPLSVPDDGILDAIICKSSSIQNSLKMLPAYTSGQYYKFPEYFEHHRLKEAHCECERLMSVVLDGETFYTHGVDLKILPKAVKIVSPNGLDFADYSQIVKGDRE